ncbi:MAG: tRNA (5-methylaminomethyl-2-thiouridine)(34)-methyltransferase MnmD, partial [Rhodospirillales bacterium]
MKTPPILPDPLVTLGDDGTPRSGVSGDVYFSTAGGVQETQHVFLGGIGAPDAWQGKQHFRIAELGFGTGLNFLVTWQAWKRSAPKGAHLDYVSVEGYPIEVEALGSILAGVPELADEAAALLAAYPPRVGGLHRLHLDGGRVRLTLLYGEVEAMLDAMTGSVDAWFLDGFAPSKNPGMW